MEPDECFYYYFAEQYNTGAIKPTYAQCLESFRGHCLSCVFDIMVKSL